MKSDKIADKLVEQLPNTVISKSVLGNFENFEKSGAKRVHEIVNDDLYPSTLDESSNSDYSLDDEYDLDEDNTTGNPLN